MRYTWDEAKSRRNVEIRGLPFDAARLIDLDQALVEEDIRHDYGENRFVAYGLIGERLHVLCFTPTDEGIRVISLRKANAREARYYEQETSDQ